ncbi:acetyl-CoA acetyltransferase [Rhodococcus sp. Leaf7]|uniref:thiolase domain-containing protein n=1 Tax=unclassified Rhodococcus (in: high G+C Gram-positive bacteria) TaxID=192944 RepID=UPI0006FFEF4F|nr:MULTISPECIES: thiolase domain-containing protein [unclassified Rhodococcus (in: high G+C Gram-positive bacteria)]KQU07142.1 acetyl-CoA acetyltransferase [Rhodococcus sp. Leaf7]KQU42660.1 acetyl-CoA acetyltransferase [Rhodococcus sp. Leaf247]
MTDTPAIIGWSHGQFGKSAHPDVEDLMADVALSALEDAEVSASDVDAIYVGVFNNGFSPQSFEGALVGVGHPELARVPATRVENACASGSAAIFAGLDHVQAGRGRVVLVIGAEKMTGLPGVDVGDVLLGASHRRTESGAGSFAGIFGNLASDYAARFGDQRQALAQIAAKNHLNGVRNPFAHMRKDLGVEFCATESDKNPVVAGPLLRSDCSLVSDGAAALVISNGAVASRARRAVTFRGRYQANEPLPLAARRDPLFFDGARTAFLGALEEAGMTLYDLDLLETHDCFTQAELMQYEAFGLAEHGKGSSVLADGITHRDGKLPTNVSGGLKAKGHPVGATGVSQHVVTAMQLTGEAGDMQLDHVDRAAVFNMGGAAVANYASILERVK